MKVREITIGVGYTYQPQAYHSAKAEAHFVVELEDDEDVGEAEQAAREQAIEALIRTLAGVDEVHTKISKKGLDPKDLLPSTVHEEDEEDTWK